MKNKKCMFDGVFVFIFLSIFVSSSSFAVINIHASSISWDWTVTEVITSTSTASTYEPDITVDRFNNRHVVWYDYTDYLDAGIDSDIFYRRWDAETEDWTSTVLVSDLSPNNSVDPSIAVDLDGNIHISWTELYTPFKDTDDQDIFYRCWNASTKTWSSMILISILSTDDCHYSNIVTSPSGDVYVTWFDETNDYLGSGGDKDIFYREWSKANKSWRTPVLVSSESSADSDNPSLAIDTEGDLHFSWRDFTDYASAGSDSDIFYKEYITSMQSWSALLVISSQSNSGVGNPSIDVSSLNLPHIAWTQSGDINGSGSDQDVFHKTIVPGLGYWDFERVISTESSFTSSKADLSLDDQDNIHFTWHGYENLGGSGPDFDIFYKMMNGTDSNLDGLNVVSTESSDDSFHPRIAVDSHGFVHIVWYDVSDYVSVDADYDVFYKMKGGVPEPPQLTISSSSSSSDGKIDLEWTPSKGAIQYSIYRGNSAISTLSEAVKITTVFQTNYTDTIDEDGTYYYVVVAENFLGESEISNSESIIISSTIQTSESGTPGFEILSAICLIALLRKKREKFNWKKL